MTRSAWFPHKSYERGNVFAMLFAAVALTGVLAAVGMQTLTGPVSTITRVTQRNVADNNLLMNAKIIVNAAVTAVAGGDSDGDGIIEPAEFVSAAVGETPPTNGGFLPTDLGLALTDPWGSKYGYCVWDHGTTNTSTNRLTGDNTSTASTQVVLALIAAGPDKTFQTTCSVYSGGPVQVTKASGSDDLIFKYSYAEAAASSNGLWTINVSDDAKAELKDTSGSAVNVTIDRDTGIGDFLGLTTSVISAKTDQTVALDGGLLLDADGGGATTCTAAEKGSLRLNSDRDDLELCDGAGGWVEVRTPPGGSAGHVQFNDGADGFAGDSNLFWDNSAKRLGVGGTPSTHTLDVTGTLGTSGNAVIGGTLGVTGATTLSSTLDVTGAATLSDMLSVSGNATFDTDTLFVDASGDKVGIGTDSPSHLLDIAGSGDMGALGSFTVGNAVLHVDDGTANLYIDGRALISDGALAVGTTRAETLQLVTDETQRILIASDGTVSITGNTGISGATSLWSTLSVAGIADFDSGTLYVDVPDSRVGVGTTDPLTKLDVAGGVKIGADSLCNISKAGMVAWNSGVLQLCGADGNWTSLAAIDKLDDIGDVDVPTPNNNDVLAWNSTDSKWVAKNIALVGPGASNPAGNDGSVQFRAGSDFDADPPHFHWDKATHRLGIGTTSPGDKLTVNGGSVSARGTADWINGFYARSPTNTATLRVGPAGVYTASEFGFVGTDSNIPFIIRAAAQPVTTFLTNGNVGIGITNPGEKLSVAGTIESTSGGIKFPDGTIQTTAASGAKGYFYKTDPHAVAFTRTGNGTVSVKAGTEVTVGATLVTYASDTAVTMPSLSAGTDYAIYACESGAPVADSNLASTALCTGASRKIGGFHYAPGGNATAQAGGDSTPQINPYSMWDIRFKPSCREVSGMTLVADSFWVDIYLTGVDHHVNGTSKYNVTIADGASPPKISLMHGGNGTSAYSTFNWYEANEVMQSHGKDLLSYGEFMTAMYGTTENSSGGSDPGSTILRAAYTSKWGVMLATGNMWVWGRDMSYRSDGTAWGWKNVTGGRGNTYTQGDYGNVAALLGGRWSNGALSGSRASSWDGYPWSSYNYVGARGRCDHLILE